MNKQERIDKLKVRFDTLKDSYNPDKGNCSVLRTIVDKIISPMLSLDPVLAENMWEYMLNKYWNRCDADEYNILTNDVFEKDALALKLREILIHNENIRNKVVLLDPYDDHTYFLCFLTDRFIADDFDFVNNMMELFILNKHGENNVRKNKFDMLDYFIDSAINEEKATKENLDFLKSWIARIDNKEDRAQLELSLFQLEDMYNYSDDDEEELEDAEETIEEVTEKDTEEDSEEDITLTLITVTLGTEQQDAEEDNATAIESLKQEHHSKTQQKVNEKALKESLDELHGLIGLDVVKKEIADLVNLVRVQDLRKKRGMKIPEISLHLVFSGNPGTGKTTVARILGKIYKSLGILSKGHLVEVDRSGLVAGYVGQTALKTQEVIQKAMGGVLFIDEVYALASKDADNDFGQEAIDTLLKAMEDHRDEFVVVVAGYSELMPDFINSNPGLKSRFNKYLYFQDYDGDALFKIFQSFVDRNDYRLDAMTEPIVYEYFRNLYNTRPENFGNARDVRNLFEKTISKQANRIIAMTNPNDDDIKTLTSEDFCAVVEREM